jgi:hypothetical protein
MKKKIPLHLESKLSKAEIELRIRAYARTIAREEGNYPLPLRRLTEAQYRLRRKAKNEQEIVKREALVRSRKLSIPPPPPSPSKKIRDRIMEVRSEQDRRKREQISEYHRERYQRLGYT